MTDILALLGRRACRDAPFKNSFSSASLPTSRSSAAMRASYSARTPCGSRIAVERPGLILGNPDADQVAADVVPLGEPVERLARQIVLDDLPLELDRIAAVLGHGLSPRKPGRDSLIRVTSPVHPVGCTPHKVNVLPPH